MSRELPKRKHPRLKIYDYSSAGAYFVTICTKDKKCIFANVGRGLAPAADKLEYTEYGKIAESQLLLLEERYPELSVTQYAIMPNHIHAILVLENNTAGASPRPTIPQIICAYKSITARVCKKQGLAGKLFQTSFYDHVIRNDKDLEEIQRYILENPLKWQLDKLYVE